MMAELEQLPGQLDLRIYRGDDTNFQITITDTTTGNPLALPTSGWRAQTRVNNFSDEILFTFTVDGSGADAGILRISITGTDTAGVTESQVVWDLENTTVDRTYLAGSIYLTGQVSK